MTTYLWYDMNIARQMVVILCETKTGFNHKGLKIQNILNLKYSFYGIPNISSIREKFKLSRGNFNQFSSLLRPPWIKALPNKMNIQVKINMKACFLVVPYTPLGIL